MRQPEKQNKTNKKKIRNNNSNTFKLIDRRSND